MVIPQGVILALKHRKEENKKRHAFFDYLNQQMNPNTPLGKSFPSSSLSNSEAPIESIFAGNFSGSPSNVRLQMLSRTWNEAFQSNVDRDEDDSKKKQRRRPTS